jgi:hypothetical protein
MHVHALKDVDMSIICLNVLLQHVCEAHL